MAKKRGPGRPQHRDGPPVILATTIPRSLDRALRDHAKRTRRPRSEHLAAIRAYLNDVESGESNRAVKQPVKTSRR